MALGLLELWLCASEEVLVEEKTIKTQLRLD